MDIDYTSYSIEQLLDVKEHIDPDIAQENYKRLLKELDRRSDEVELLENRHEEKRTRTIFKRTKVIAYYQLICGFIFVLILLVDLVLSGPEGIGKVIFSPALIVILLQLSAGWLLLKERTSGFILSYVNQLAQLLRFSLGGIAYQYTAILSFGPIFERNVAEFNILLSPTLSLNTNTTEVAPFLSINLLAIMIITLLGKRQELAPSSSEQ